ncbi:hypothetical protein [Rubricoccus marinus]|uniref:Carboxypeptidase regulatory-like domain-containing protein n=1 Tax=Rubricoccus marinus TaxID=716817 RepID=A0A259U0D2_9BACT|nr:hypothetical protein [Rubricoccus marinus]OZC03483.1 hypothetical protein BSZ36_11115 [Rubricoccus marinus]
MRYVSLSAILLALAFFVLPASAQEARGVDDVPEFTFEIQYESEAPSERRANMATITVSGLGRSAPELKSINLSTSERAERRGTIRLTRNEDGTYTGRGEVPANSQIQSVTLGYTEVEWTLQIVSLKEGENEAGTMITPSGARARKGKGKKVTVRVRCCPFQVIVVVRGIEAETMNGRR